MGENDFGAEELKVKSTNGYEPKQSIAIDEGTSTFEVNRIRMISEAGGTPTLYLSHKMKFIHKAGATVTAKAAAVPLEQKMKCLEFTEFCGTPTEGWDKNTSCTCSGEEVEYKGQMMGSFCSAWTDMNSAPWCTVSPYVSCGPVEAFHGKHRSSGPCSLKVEPFSQALVNSWILYKSLLLFAGLLGVSACCSACCEMQKIKGSTVYISPGPARRPGEWSEADTDRWRQETPPAEQFVWATQQATALIDGDTPQDVRLELYALYHQAVDGNAPEFAPVLSNDPFPGLAHRAWRDLSAARVSPIQAKRRYVDAVLKLDKGGQGLWIEGAE